MPWLEFKVVPGIAQDLLDAGVPPRDIVYALEKEKVTAIRKTS
jgi:hypothetical protein